jgi:MFS family permease
MMRSWLGYPKKLWILAIGMVINITGNSFLWPLTTIYVSEVLGRSITTAGIVLMLQAAAGMIGSLLGGALYDKIGGRKAILLGIGISITAVITIALTQIWSVYLVMMILLGFGNGIIPPTVYAMASGVWPEGGRKTFNLLYVMQNIGVALGTALGGIVAEYSFKISFFSNGFTFLFFALLVWFGLNEHIAREPRGTIGFSSVRNREPKKNRRGFYALLILCLGFMFCWITYVQWQTSLSTYMLFLGYPLSSYSLLWTINGLLIILLQPFSAVIVRRILPSIRGQLLAGIALFATTFLVLCLVHHQYSSFIIGMTIMTIGEIFIWPAVPNGAAQLAPEGKRGFYQGMVNSFATAGRMLGPIIGGSIYDNFNITIMLYVMIFILFLALTCFGTYSLILRKKLEKLHG